MNKLYDKRNTEELGRHFTNHLSAMTSENLQNKYDIAAELAYRDSVIEKLNYDNDSLSDKIYSLQCLVDNLMSDNDELTKEIKILTEQIDSPTNDSNNL